MNMQEVLLMTVREAQLVLADGSVFEGEAIGAEPPDGVASGEVVFNTVLSGYQEVITDPSYAGQIITFTATHIGNYGVNLADFEARRPFCRGVIVRELARRRSNWRAEADLGAMLRRYGVPGIAGIDTRRLTRLLRDTGAMPGAFGTADEATLRAAAVAEPGTDGIDLVAAGHDARALHRGRRHGGAAGDRLRLRHQALDPPLPVGDLHRRGRSRRARPPPTCSPAGRTASSCRTAPATRRRRLRGGRDPRAARRGAGVRHLPRPSADVVGDRRHHVQAAVRPSRRQPSRAPRGDGAHRDHQPEPQLLRRSGVAGRRRRP